MVTAETNPFKVYILLNLNQLLRQKQVYVDSHELPVIQENSCLYLPLGDMFHSDIHERKVKWPSRKQSSTAYKI